MDLQTIDVNFEMALHVDVEVECVFTPGRPAPACQNPSSPAFSDCGDPEEIDDLHVFLARRGHKGKIIRLEITDFIDDESDIEEEVLNNLPEEE
jgi:hypothetical protein